MLGVIWGASLIPATAAPPPGFYLVWGDEFDGASLDATKWDYWLLGNHRDAVNTSSAVSVGGGCLTITTYTASGRNYSAMIAGEHKFRSRYGYYEASIKWGDTNGMWSAFWLRSPILGTYLNDPYDDGAEIDICEHRYVGKYLTNYIAHQVSDNIHWNGYGPSHRSSGSPNVPATQPGVSVGFHTFGLLWEPHNYSFRIDDGEVWNGTSTTPPFGSCVYPILSSEVDDTSTTWAGLIPAGGYPGRSASNVKMVVDYYRYYAPTNVLFWTAAASAYWTNSANWVANCVPLATSDLTFSFLSANLASVLGKDSSVKGLVFLNMNSTPSIGGVHTLSLGANGIDMVSSDKNVTLNCPVNVAANQTWFVGRNNPGNLLTVNASLGGAATLTKAGYGTLILNGTNSFSGVLNVDTGANGTNDGALVITRSSAIANVQSPIYIRNTGAAVSRLQLSNGVVVLQRISLAGRSNSTPAIQAAAPPGATTVLGGGVTLAGGGPYYAIQCDAGSLSLTGTVAALSAATSPCSLTLRGNGAFVLSGLVQNGSPYPLSLVKSNSGSLTLSGVNAFTGPMTNWGGNLFVNSSLPGALFVNGGALSGTGYIAGEATIQSGEISPGVALGNSIGALSFGASLSLGPSLMTLMEISAAPQTNDVLNVSGKITYGGTLYVANLGGELVLGQSFKLFSAGSYAGGFSTLTLPALKTGWAWDTTRLKSDGSISVAAVPAVSVSPASAGVECPGAVTLSATASGTAPLTYQWFDNQTNAISGATNAVLALNLLTLAQSGSYTVLVTNNAGSASSVAAVALSDTTPPVITLVGANPLIVPWHAAFVDPGATALDACAGPVPATASGTVDTGVLGAYTLAYTAADPSGNAATATRAVNVVEPTLSITDLGGGQVQLNWNLGNLQSATNLSGPYTNVPGAVAPYACPATNTQQFFRVR